jgi:hypothetical protein
MSPGPRSIDVREKAVELRREVGRMRRMLGFGCVSLFSILSRGF